MGGGPRDEIEVPTLDGRVTLKVRRHQGRPEAARPGSRPAQAPRWGGDLYCVLAIVIPPEPGEREKALYRQLSAASRFDPRAHLRKSEPA